MCLVWLLSHVLELIAWNTLFILDLIYETDIVKIVTFSVSIPFRLLLSIYFIATVYFFTAEIKMYPEGAPPAQDPPVWTPPSPYKPGAPQIIYDPYNVYVGTPPPPYTPSNPNTATSPPPPVVDLHLNLVGSENTSASTPKS